MHSSTCRNRLTQRAKTSGAQFAPQNAATMIGKFIHIVNRFHAEYNLKPSEVWAADETGIQPYSTAKSTVDHRGVKSVRDCERCTLERRAQVRITGAGNEKTSYSVMLCASAAGQKLPAAVVLARTRPLTKVQNENQRYLKLYYTGANGTKWYNQNVTIQWLKDYFNVSFLFVAPMIIFPLLRSRHHCSAVVVFSYGTCTRRIEHQLCAHMPAQTTSTWHTYLPDVLVSCNPPMFRGTNHLR